MWLKTIPITLTCHRIVLCRIKTLQCNDELWRITKNTCECAFAVISTTEIISTLHLVLIHLLFFFFCILQRTNASRSGFKFAGNSTALWIVWHENASSQRYRRCSAKFGRCSHGHCGISRHHTNQHILLGKNTKDFIQTKTFSRQTASRRICTSLAPPFLFVVVVVVFKSIFTVMLQ